MGINPFRCDLSKVHDQPRRNPIRNQSIKVKMNTLCKVENRRSFNGLYYMHILEIYKCKLYVVAVVVRSAGWTILALTTISRHVAPSSVARAASTTDNPIVRMMSLCELLSSVIHVVFCRIWIQIVVGVARSRVLRYVRGILLGFRSCAVGAG